MRKNPYAGLPDRQFWKNDPGIADYPAFDPVSEVPFRISRSDKVVTAGSCFAQHLAHGLVKSGFNHFVTEKAHPMFPESIATAFNYGAFSARYGNVYTTRQFHQLLLRAYGEFQPVEAFWPRPGSQTRVVDPFRPQIQPDGFVSAEELAADRVQHFAAIRRAVEECDVMVFTLGLTECWEDVRDGAIYPLAPGVAGGVYDPACVRFRNFGVADSLADLMAALNFVRARNPDVRLLLTVSPVPLNATYENRHVAVATTFSKAVLRVVADAAAGALPMCAYFPSYEIITSPQARGRYFGPDCRSVLAEGVAHVMRTFFRHFSEDGPQTAVPTPTPASTVAEDHRAEMERPIDVLCDEEAISNT
ncbi:MAG: GSCFA domain-containing protein [Paracoccaceae bacterium]|nr:MAG: GSCFA domain-containing protein [Paracoccaceae bacterium]